MGVSVCGFSQKSPVAVCCSVSQCVAVCCSVLQCVAVRCSASQHVAVCCVLAFTEQSCRCVCMWVRACVCVPEKPCGRRCIRFCMNTCGCVHGCGCVRICACECVRAIIVVRVEMYRLRQSSQRVDSRSAFGVATISRLLKIMGLFCKRAL